MQHLINEKIADILVGMGVNYSLLPAATTAKSLAECTTEGIRPVSKKGMSISCQVGLAYSNLECIIESETGWPGCISFTISAPIYVEASKAANILLYIMLINQQEKHHPGHWNLNLEHGTMYYSKRWPCDVLGTEFNQLFRDIFLGCVATVEDCMPGIKALLNEEITPQDACRAYLNRYSALLN
jgi:hypothetical protein